MAFPLNKIASKSNDFTANWPPKLLAIALMIVLELIIAYQVVELHPLYLIFFLLVICILLFVFFSLENALLFLLIYMAFDGFIKNLTSYTPSFHVAKDVFLIIIFAVYLLGKILKKERLFPATPLNIPILVFIAICFLQFLNPATHPIIGLGGIKTHVLPIVLFPLSFSLFTDKKQISRFMVVLIALGTVVAAYSFVQYAQGPDSVAKLGPGFANVVYDRAALWKSASTKTMNFRPFSTTQDCGAAAMYYLITIPLTLAFLLTKKSWGQRKLLSTGSIGLLFLALVLSGVRSAWLATILGLLLFGILSKKMRSFFIVLFLGGTATYLAIFLSGGGIIERILMTANPWQAFMEARGLNITTYLVWAIYAYPFGRGLGRAGPGEAVFANWFPQEAGSFAGSDNYFLVMVYETGLIGALVILWISLAILFNGYRIYNQLQDQDLKWTAVGIMAALFAMLLTWLAGPTLISNPASFYFWFLSGMLLKLGHIATLESSPAPSPPEVIPQ